MWLLLHISKRGHKSAQSYQNDADTTQPINTDIYTKQPKTHGAYTLPPNTMTPIQFHQVDVMTSKRCLHYWPFVGPMISQMNSNAEP